MADGISIIFKMVTKPFEDFAADQLRRQRRATMYAMRSAGRAGKAVAQARAPLGVAASKRDKRVVVGRLRNAIRPSRNIRQGATFTMKLGPRHVPYAAKIEERDGYMAAGYAAVNATLPAAMEKAASKVWRSGGNR